MGARKPGTASAHRSRPGASAARLRRRGISARAGASPREGPRRPWTRERHLHFIMRTIVAPPPDIAAARVYAQVEIFLQGLKKPEAISIACPGGLPSERPV